MDGDARLIETQQHRFGLDPFDAQADDVGEAVDRIAEDGHPVDLLGDAPQPVGLGAGGLLFAGHHARRRELGGRGPEPDGRHHVLQPGPPSPFLFATDQQRLDPEPPSHDEGADPGRAAELVGRHRHQVGAEPLDVEGQVPGGGHGVDVDGDAEA